MGEHRSPVLDSRRERALDSSLGVRGGRDKSVVTGVPRYSPVMAMRYASTLDFSRVSAVASAAVLYWTCCASAPSTPRWVGEGGVMRAS